MEHLGHLSIILSLSISLPCPSLLFYLFLPSILSLLLSSQQYGLLGDLRRYLYLLMKDLLILFEDAVNIEAVHPLELVCLCARSPPMWLQGAERALLVPLIVHLLPLLYPLLLLLLVRLIEPLGSEGASLIGHPLLGRGR